ncbi:MAG: 2-C-methyl-D-erythritol 2,4-cyclodiphosphate synthase [Planctomycetota bacterium]|jgi:2-C-methyl-D-erythritol 2,4-cyclodiphosphate synthase
MRVGTGYDLHRLGADRPLRLGGVEIPGGPGLVGHSDADCVLHAISDSLLGASSLGDIGQHFPDDDPAWKDADSGELMRRVAGMVREAGYVIVNVDCTVLAERPRLAPHRLAMRGRIAELLSIPEQSVGVKATTLEGLGPLGRSEAIACHAACLLEETK